MQYLNEYLVEGIPIKFKAGLLVALIRPGFCIYKIIINSTFR